MSPRLAGGGPDPAWIVVVVIFLALVWLTETIVEQVSR